jgi:hypothetical protein
MNPTRRSKFNLNHSGNGMATVTEIPEEVLEEVPEGTSSSGRKVVQTFLPTLPERIFVRLIRLPRRAWAVYMVLTLQHRLRRRPASIILTNQILARFGLTKWDKFHALACLEAAGLIAVRRQHGKNPSITLLETCE